jgi:two-component system CheB/CheR fusion protein
VVGVGASAGGLEALEGFLRALPPSTGMAFVIVQHLSPDHKSHMAELLSKHTAMRVLMAEDGMAIAPNTIYLIPPGKVLLVRAQLLRLEERGAGLALPVDALFRSLAEEFRDRAAGVVLSGTGSDGTRGVRALHEAGGLVVVQDPPTAKFDGMPRAAISLGIADHVIPVAQMAEKLVYFAQHAQTTASVPPPHASREEDAFHQLMDLLRRQTGVDFSRYKSTTISRRIQRRMAICQLEELGDYVALAQQNPREVGTLFKELLISVTRFFRDPDVFDVLRREVIPSLVDRTRPGETLRVWVAGCATGEEAYSLAMLFEEYFEAGGRPREVKIFATDIDRDALEFAGAGVYPASIVADVAPERLERFFVRQNDSFQVARFLRQRVVFANHDLTKDPPFSRVSLVTCRNVLIYFNQEMQGQVIGGFRFALRPGGYMLLGNSETPGDLGAELVAVNTGAKIFRRTEVRSRLPEPREGAGFGLPGAASPGSSSATRPTLEPHIHEAFAVLLGAYAPPSVLFTEQHEVLHIFGEPSPLLRFNSGAASLNLLQLLPPQVASVVSLATHRVLRSDEPACYHAVPTDRGLATVTVRPVPRRSGGRLFIASFAIGQPEDPLEPPGTVSADAGRQITDLQQELQFSRENLQATIEELETSNEELQATNEELIASNEELQSTNEELQSVNEELHTLNGEYQRKITELVSLNDDINNLLINTRLGSIFLDSQLRITRFTPAISQVMNLLDRDIGRPISHLSFRFNAGGFFSTLDTVLRTKEAIERDYILPDGQAFILRVAPYVSEAPGGAGWSSRCSM